MILWSVHFLIKIYYTPKQITALHIRLFLIYIQVNYLI